ncbi:MAG: TonB-dependent receptor domain-containing protein [Acidobacteriota bacterium]
MKGTLSKGLFLLLALVVAVSCPSYLGAQAVYGTIIGTVSDETGGVLPGAEVTITNVGQGTAWTLTTDSAGNFRKERLVPGSEYTVKVSLPGFKTYTQENVTVNTDAVVDLKITLPLGEITEQVTVTGATTALMKTEKTDVAVAFTERELEELPIFQRNFTQFLLLSPGTQSLAWQHASSENPQGSKQIMVNGQHFSGTGFQLDGTSNRDPILGIIVINPTLEGVTEAKVTTQNYDAEFGQATAGVVTAQTKSGTNTFHGSAFIFRRNDDLMARNPFSQSNPLSADEPNKFIPDTLWDQFGGSIGGPIVKDKAFFFFDYQGTRRKNGGSVLTTVPTLAARDGDLSEYIAATGRPIFDPLTGDATTGAGRQEFAGGVIPTNRLSPQALNLIRQLPLPNLPGIENNFSTGGIEAFDDDAFNVRGDWAYTDNLHIFGRYSFADFDRKGPGAFGEVLGGPAFDNIFFAGASSVRNQSVAAGFDHVLSPTLLTDFRFGFFRYFVQVLPGGVGTTPAADAGIPNLNSVPGLNQDPIFTSGMPFFDIQGTGGFRLGYSLGANQCNCPLTESEQQWQVVNNWIMSRGEHTYKFGADIRWAQNLRVPSDSHRAGELFFKPERTQGDVGGGLGIASFLVGDVSSFGRFVSETTDAKERQKRWFFYGQDTWKVNPKLTVNYGLRWEIYFPEKVTQDGSGGNFDPATGNIEVLGIGGISRDGNIKNRFTNIAPRLGVTYQLSPKTVLRMGYGRSYDLGVFGSTFGHAVTQNLPVLAQQNLNPAANFESVFNLADGPETPPFPSPDRTGLLKAPDGVALFVRPRKTRIPTLDAWNITLQHEMRGDMAWEVAYVGNKGTHVFAGDGPDYNFNQPIIDGFTDGISSNDRKPFFAGPIRGFGGPFGLSQGFRYFGNDASNNYNALQAKFDKRFSSGWTLLAHYTLARSYNYDGSYYIWSAPLAYGPANTDRKSVLVLNSLVELPFGRGKRFGSDVSRGLDALIGGWQVNFTTNWSSGLPFSATNRDCGILRDTGPCRPDRVGDPGIDGNRNLWFAVGAGPNAPWQIPQPGTFGTEERNDLRGPGFFNTDFSIFKNVKMPWFSGEEATWQFRAEFFNLFNHVNLGRPGGGRFNGGACVNCNPAEDGRITGLPQGASVRQIQLALRFQF